MKLFSLHKVPGKYNGWSVQVLRVFSIGFIDMLEEPRKKYLYGTLGKWRFSYPRLQKPFYPK